MQSTLVAGALAIRQSASSAGMAGEALGVVPEALGVAPEASRVPRKRVLRLAHLTDSHVQPERDAHRGLAACLHHVGELTRPDLILAGGDNIMEAFNTPADRADVQFRLWKQVLADHSPAPVIHCIGNHDVWGWDKTRSGTTGDEPLWGKRWAVDAFGMPDRHFSFDRAGWHFVVLDSTFPDPGGYKGRLDDAQFEWLGADLAATPPTTPVAVLSHIPILAACAYFDGDNEKSGDWVVPGSWMHIDARRIKDLFYRHRNVKLALSGHIHLVDRVDYLGVSYLCNGAVSAGWWKGPNQECQTGYGVVDLYDDGTFESEYVLFPWTPVP